METVPEYWIHRKKAWSGRPRATVTIEDRHLSIKARRNKEATASQLFRYLYAATEPREPGTRYLPSNVEEIDNYGGGGLMVWAGIMLDGRTSLHVFERGFVTGVRHRDEVLGPYVFLFRDECGPEFIVMDDNARPHGALLVDEDL
ncbi:transposable element Tcb2 transposase [Trichonephila clavipes]|nr:transposable element Tcb2 transposase [Trichonephila clavipes]